MLNSFYFSKIIERNIYHEIQKNETAIENIQVVNFKKILYFSI